MPDDHPNVGLLERARIATELLEAIAADWSLLDQLPAGERQRLHQAVAGVYNPDPVARRQRQKAAERARNAAHARKTDAVRHETGIRTLRRQTVFTTPNVFPPEDFKPLAFESDEPDARETIEPQHCCGIL